MQYKYILKKQNQNKYKIQVIILVVVERVPNSNQLKTPQKKKNRKGNAQKKQNVYTPCFVSNQQVLDQNMLSGTTRLLVPIAEL